jgi:PAS domain S-box-containing protein
VAGSFFALSRESVQLQPLRPKRQLSHHLLLDLNNPVRPQNEGWQYVDNCPRRSVELVILVLQFLKQSVRAFFGTWYEENKYVTPYPRFKGVRKHSSIRHFFSYTPAVGVILFALAAALFINTLIENDLWSLLFTAAAIFTAWVGGMRAGSQWQNAVLHARNQEFECVNQQLFNWFKHAPNGMVLFDASPPYRVLTSNSVYHAFLDEPFRTQGIDGKYLTDFIPRAQEEGLLALFHNAVKTQQGQTLYNFVFDGFERGRTYWNWSLTPVIVDGTVTMLVHMAVEVTEEVLTRQRLEAEIAERKQAEKSLRQQREILQQIIDYLPVMITIYEPDTQVLYLNPEFERLIGWRTPELGNINLMEQVYPDPDYRAMVSKYMQSLEPGWRDFALTARDGSIVNSSWANILLSDRRQVGIGIDVRERVHNELHSRQLLTLTSALSNALALEDVVRVIGEYAVESLDAERGIVALLTDDRTAVDVVWFNYQAPADNLRQRYQRVPIEADVPLVEAARTGQPIWVESLAEYKTRYPKLVAETQAQVGTEALAALPFGTGSETVGAIVVSFQQAHIFPPADRLFMRSISEVCAQALKRARLYEAEQRARQEAEQANRLKTQFIGMISHELRTPLTSIKGFVTTLLETDVEFTREQERQFLGIMNQETDKLTELIEQLLNLVRLQAGTLPIEPTVNTMQTVLDLASVQLNTLAARHRLHIHEMERIPAVMADKVRIAQVLVNLVGNAVKFSPAGSLISLDAHQEGEFVQIDVSDEGMGIPTEARTHVFEAFRQVQRQGETFSKGAGLGLAICKGLVEAHGGQIWIQDRPGSGTTMSFTLPVAGK